MNVTYRFVPVDTDTQGPGEGLSPDLVFTSNWNTTTGSSSNALTDGNLWNICLAGSGSANADSSFESGTSITQNILGVFLSLGFGVSGDAGYWGIPAVGEYLAVRYQAIFDTGGTVTPTVQVASNTFGFNRYYSQTGTVAQGQRAEYHTRIRRVADSEWYLDARVYTLDASFNRTLVVDIDEWVNLSDPFDTLSDTSFAFPTAVQNATQGYYLGMQEGQVDSSVHPAHHIGGCAISGESFAAHGIGWHFSHGSGGATSGPYWRVSAFAVWQGTTANGFWDWPAFNAAEVDFTPTAL